jgi:hypothetical protein
MLVAAVIQTCRLELLQVPRQICPSPPRYTSLKEDLSSDALLFWKYNNFSLGLRNVKDRCHS